MAERASALGLGQGPVELSGADGILGERQGALDVKGPSSTEREGSHMGAPRHDGRSMRQAQLRRELEQVKDTKVAMGNLRQDVGFLKTSKGSMESRLWRVITISDALACLVSNVDIMLKPREVADVFVEGLMPEDLKEARQTIRSALGAKYTKRRG